MNGRVLVGRDHELAEIDAALTDAFAGPGAVLLLSGEPGIGKTRLLAEIAARVTRLGGRAAFGRTLEVGLTPAFWPWLEMLGALRQDDDDDTIPKLGGLDQRADASTRLALFAEVTRFLTRRAPAALLFDDMHAADPSSLQLLEYVAPLLAGKRILVAIAVRDGDAPREIGSALGRIQRGARRIALGRLGPEAVRVLVGEGTNARRVFELSEGNPLFVEELVLAGDGPLPEVSSVRAVIRDRVARLAGSTGELLVAAAVVGRDFRSQVVADILGIEDAAFGARLAPALRIGMVTVTSPDRYRFSHALIAEAMADELDPSARARLHLRAAEAVERHEGKTLGAMAVAHHLLSAGHLAAGAAVTAAERAAEGAMAQLAFEDAAALLERAARALSLAAPDDRVRRAHLLCSWAEALQHSAQHPRAAELCDEAAGIARSVGGGELLARIALTRGLEFRFGRTDPVLVEALREALALLGSEQIVLRARALARLAAAEQPAPDPSGPLAQAFEAIELAKGLPARDRIDVMYVATIALVDYVDVDILEPLNRQLLELARAAGERVIAVHMQLRLCFNALERLDRPALDAAFRSLTGQATALGLPRWTRHVHAVEAMMAVLEGRFAEAERAADRVDEMSVAIGDPNAKFMVDVHRALAAWTRTAPAGHELEETLVRYAPGRAPIQAWMAIQRGAIDEARAALREIRAELPGDPDLAAMVASAVAAAGTPEVIAAVYRLLLPRTGQIALTSMVGFAVVDLYDRLLLVLATALENWDVVDGHAEGALGTAVKLGSPVWAARVRADWAEALERRRRPGDEERVRELRAAALADAERFDMPGLLSRCRSVVPAARDVTTASTRDRVRLTRVGELWLLRGFGEEVHVKDSRGMHMLEQLLADPGREVHALDLAGATEGVDGGDAGELLDPAARAEYRTRRSELVSARDEAEARGDLGHAERAATEIEALTSELERAVALGGRERRAGAATERARSNVQRRVNHAIEQIRAGSRRLGEHLRASVRTGSYCVYDPRG